MTAAVLSRKPLNVVPDQDIIKIMAKLGATADQALAGHITFIKFCPTPDGRGAHMVVSTDQGPMTIIFMPKVQVNDGEMVEFDQMHALLVDLGHGSAAIIGDMSQSLESLAPLVRELHQNRPSLSAAAPCFNGLIVAGLNQVTSGTFF